MDITVDTSILIAVVSDEPSRSRAIEVTAGHGLVAPHSVHWEIGNALFAMIKRDRVTLAQAHACVEAYLRLPIKWVDIDLKQALGVVKQSRVYAYDAYLLVCAMQMGTPLLTLDKSLQLAAANLGIEILEV